MVLFDDNIIPKKKLYNFEIVIKVLIIAVKTEEKVIQDNEYTHKY